MEISKVDLIQAPEHMRYLWVQIHTDEGLIGLGETYIHAEASRSVIEHLFAPLFLLGRDPLRIEENWQFMFDRANYVGWAGAEMRALSAIDIALWDILGQHTGQPVYQLLGGKCREKIKIYNTFSPDEEFGSLANPAELAQDLLDQGIRAMKIYPFDHIAQRTRGQYLSLDDLQEGLDPIRQIRNAVGNAMEIAIEFHGHWNLPSAIRIATALEEFGPLWIEDILQPKNLEAYEKLSRSTGILLAVSERLFTRYQFLPFLQKGVIGVANPDVEWCGGITEAKKIAALADTYQVPIAPHNYGGPLLNFASAHVAASVPNLMILESGRDLLEKWRDRERILSQPTRIENGFMLLPEGPGLGTTLSVDFLRRDDLLISSIT